MLDNLGMADGKRNLYLVGMPGSGKSTIGKVLSRHLNLDFVDADQELVSRTGVSIANIFQVEGEAGFRVRESQLLATLSEQDRLLLATGGGVVLRQDNREILQRTGIVIYLHATLDHLWQRTRHDSRRPLLQTENPRSVLKSLLDTRDPLYRQVADLTVETGRQSIGKLVSEIDRQLDQRNLWPPGRLPTSAGDGNANVNNPRGAHAIDDF